MALSKDYILAVRGGVKPERDDFAEKEHAADALADRLAEYLTQSGYKACSQSDESNFQNGNFDGATRSSLLPHKTLARLAGIGYIGKNNLLINERYGCALVLGTVLTDAPAATFEYTFATASDSTLDVAPNTKSATASDPEVISASVYTPDPSGCGDCDVCRSVCDANAIFGNEWSIATGRDGVIDVAKCTCSLKCMVHCPATLKYATSV